MARLNLPATDNTPEINFNIDDLFFSLHGISVPENPNKFYDPVLLWLNEKLKLKKLYHLKVVLSINIKYFSTTSAKYILKIVATFNDACNLQNSDFTVEWCYQEEDEDMKEAGELIQKLSNSNFIYKSFK